MDQLPFLEVTKTIEEFCESNGYPDLVYTHFGEDLNIDHRITHDAVMTAFRPQPQCGVKEIRSFEVLSSTGWAGAGFDRQFSPVLFVGIEEFLPKKLQALECYCEEMRDWPHARSLRAVQHLAAMRGSQIGLRAAEAFQIDRKII